MTTNDELAQRLLRFTPMGSEFFNADYTVDTSACVDWIERHIKFLEGANFRVMVSRNKKAEQNAQLLDALRLARQELAEYAEADEWEQEEGAGVYARPWDRIGSTLDAIDAAIAAATQEATR